MWISSILFAGAALASADAGQDKRQLNLGPSVKFSTGTVNGRSLLGVDSFKGIHFAEAPVGNLRLRPPQRITRDQGVIDGTQQEPACIAQSVRAPSGPQVPNNLTSNPLIQQLNGGGQTEDCLTVNVFRPSTATSASNLPVIVWIYGGGFETGSTQIYDGTPLVSLSVAQGSPVIVAMMNYRLAAYGFLGGKELVNEGSTNLGLLDQRQALEWIADNIGAFGGDPSKVTIWGESAGAISVFDQLLLFNADNTYKGKPLFRGAIMESGTAIPADSYSGPKAQAVYDNVVAAAGCSGAANTTQCLRGVSTQTFTNAMNSQPGIFDYQSVALSYLPRPDGRVLVQSPGSQAQSGGIVKVPMIITDCEDEGTLFSLVQSNLTTTDDLVTYINTYFFPQASRDRIQGLVDAYPNDPSAGSPFRTGPLYNIYGQYKRLAAILGDLTFTLTRRLVLNVFANNMPDVPVWSGLISNLYGAPVVGTLHGSDILSSFGYLPGNTQFSLQSYIISFVNTLDPNNGPITQLKWPQWKEKKQLVHFNALLNTYLTDDFRPDQYNYLVNNQDILQHHMTTTAPQSNPAAAPPPKLDGTSNHEAQKSAAIPAVNKPLPQTPQGPQAAQAPQPAQSIQKAAQQQTAAGVQPNMPAKPAAPSTTTTAVAAGAQNPAPAQTSQIAKPANTANPAQRAPPASGAAPSANASSQRARPASVANTAQPTAMRTATTLVPGAGAGENAGARPVAPASGAQQPTATVTGATKPQSAQSSAAATNTTQTGQPPKNGTAAPQGARPNAVTAGTPQAGRPNAATTGAPQTPRPSTNTTGSQQAARSIGVTTGASSAARPAVVQAAGARPAGQATIGARSAAQVISAARPNMTINTVRPNPTAGTPVNRPAATAAVSGAISTPARPVESVTVAPRNGATQVAGSRPSTPSTPATGTRPVSTPAAGTSTPGRMTVSVAPGRSIIQSVTVTPSAAFGAVQPFAYRPPITVVAGSNASRQPIQFTAGSRPGTPGVAQRLQQVAGRPAAPASAVKPVQTVGKQAATPAVGANRLPAKPAATSAATAAAATPTRPPAVTNAVTPSAGAASTSTPTKVDISLHYGSPLAAGSTTAGTASSGPFPMGKNRMDNRERKKRWREANEDRNKDNDLRSRVNKRAHKLFGVGNTRMKELWIEEEFSKRKAKRQSKEGRALDQIPIVEGTELADITFGDLGRAILHTLTLYTKEPTPTDLTLPSHEELVRLHEERMKAAAAQDPLASLMADVLMREPNVETSAASNGQSDVKMEDLQSVTTDAQDKTKDGVKQAGEGAANTPEVVMTGSSEDAARTSEKSNAIERTPSLVPQSSDATQAATPQPLIPRSGTATPTGHGSEAFGRSMEDEDEDEDDNDPPPFDAKQAFELTESILAIAGVVAKEIRISQADLDAIGRDLEACSQMASVRGELHKKVGSLYEIDLSTIVDYDDDDVFDATVLTRLEEAMSE
ncbi:hypothetical protein PYCC9005_000395 [Savitreella phatthalungensis]